MRLILLMDIYKDSWAFFFALLITRNIQHKRLIPTITLHWSESRLCTLKKMGAVFFFLREKIFKFLEKNNLFVQVSSSWCCPPLCWNQPMQSHSWSIWPVLRLWECVSGSGLQLLRSQGVFSIGFNHKILYWSCRIIENNIIVLLLCHHLNVKNHLLSQQFCVTYFYLCFSNLKICFKAL